METLGTADAATIVSRVYAANTVGAIAGAIGFSLIVIPLAGSQQAQRLLIALSAAGAVVLLMPWRHHRLAPAAAGLLRLRDDSPMVPPPFAGRQDASRAGGRS